MPRRTDPDQDDSLRPPRPATPGRDGPAGPEAAPPPGPPGQFPTVASVAELLRGDRFEADRFQVGAISGTWAVRDTHTGATFILKRNGRAYDTDNEAIVGRFHEALGRAYPRVRFAVPGQTSWVLMQHVNDYPDAGELLGMGQQFIGPVQAHSAAAVRRLVGELADALEPLRLLLGDFIVDNTDRHNKNWLVMSVAGQPGAKRIVPVDHGFTLLGRGMTDDVEERPSFAATEETAAGYDDTDYDAYLAERLEAGATLPRYLGGWNAPVAFLEMTRVAVESRRVSVEQLAAEYDRVVAGWAEALHRVGLEDLDPAHVGRVRRLMSERIATLLGERRAYVGLLAGGSW